MLTFNKFLLILLLFIICSCFIIIKISDYFENKKKEKIKNEIF